METVALARNAMATRFELLLSGENPVALRAAGEEALDEIDRLENQLSLYRPASEVARINALAHRESVRVSASTFKVLSHAKKISAETGGAFDITIAPLVRCWGFMGGTGRKADPLELAEARANVGMSLVELDDGESTVRFAREGVMVDLGAIGKGYALDRAAATLRALGVESALLHGGTSTVYAIGRPPDAEAWQVAVDSPDAELSGGRTVAAATVGLCDNSLSVSAIWGRSFKENGRTFGHVIDPRTGEPVSNTLMTAVVLPSAMDSDAISTALLVMGEQETETIQGIRPEARFLGAGRDAPDEVSWHFFGNMPLKVP